MRYIFFILCMIIFSHVYPQKSFYITPIGGLNQNFTELNDLRQNDDPLYTAWSFEGGILIGYQFNSLPIAIHSGIIRSNHASTMRIRDADPVIVGFGKPFRTYLRFKTWDYPIHISFRLLDKNYYNFSLFSGFTFVQEAANSINRDVLIGDKTILNNGTKYTLNYEYDPFHLSYSTKRIELGFNYNHKITNSLQIGIQGSMRLGLAPIIFSAYNFSISSSESGLIWAQTNSKIFLTHKGDSFAFLLRLSYYPFYKREAIKTKNKRKN